MGSRRHFSREFKLEAVKMVTHQGHALAQVARDLDITRGTLARWRKQFEQQGIAAFPRGGTAQVPAEGQETRQLRRDLQRVRQERDILKKALAIFSDRRL